MERICDIKAVASLIERAENLSEDMCPVMTSYELSKKGMELSCGRGVMCREGLKQLSLIFADIINGRGREDDMDVLGELLEVIIECNECELSFSIAAAVSDMLEKYEADLVSHIKRRSCRALICPGCHTVHIDPVKCRGGGECIRICPENAVLGGEGLFSVIVQSKCVACNLCISSCPNGAVSGAGNVKPFAPDTPGPVGSIVSHAKDGGRVRRRRG